MPHFKLSPARRRRRPRGPLPAALRPEQVVAVVDSREQRPLDLRPLQTEIGTLTTGDYTARGLESELVIERKEESDLLACVGSDRSRFERELKRMLAYPSRVLMIESTWDRLERGGWRSQVTPTAVIGSLLAWSADGIPIAMTGNHQRAGFYVARLLFTVARRRYRQLRQLVEGLAEDMER